VQELADAKPAKPKRARAPPAEPADPAEVRRSQRPKAEVNYAKLVDSEREDRGPREAVDYTERIKMLQLDAEAAEKLRAEMEARREGRGERSGEGKKAGPKDSGKGVRVQVRGKNGLNVPLGAGSIAHARALGDMLSGRDSRWSLKLGRCAAEGNNAEKCPTAPAARQWLTGRKSVRLYLWRHLPLVRKGGARTRLHSSCQHAWGRTSTRQMFSGLLPCGADS
jgi:hypothetical protein